LLFESYFRYSTNRKILVFLPDLVGKIMKNKSFYLFVVFVFFSNRGTCYVLPEQLFPTLFSSHHRLVASPQQKPTQQQAALPQESVQKDLVQLMRINGFDEFNDFMASNQESKRPIVLKIDSMQVTGFSLFTVIFTQVAELLGGDVSCAMLNLFEHQDNYQLAHDLIAPLYAAQGKLLTSLYDIQLPIFLLFLHDEFGVIAKILPFKQDQFSRDYLYEAIKSHLMFNKVKK